MLSGAATEKGVLIITPEKVIVTILGEGGSDDSGYVR